MSEVFPAPAVLGTDVIGVPQGEELSLDVSLESLSEGIWVSGTVSAEAVGECGRCLDEVRQHVDTRVQGLFAFNDSQMGDEDEESEDVFEFDGETVDLEEVVRDAVVTQLPFTPLCRPDCPGLCDQCGARLAEDPDHAHDVIDPRWSALQSLSEEKES
ncbi:YceD family protein [Demequina sp.]|uniref:YceD family protein n=1 Tax=Demequina sp. TaxID=2050685 RepID=UPI003A839072